MPGAADMPAAGWSRRRLLLLAPLGAALLGGAAFWAMLERMAEGSFDPHGVPNPLVGHRVPDFTLPAQPPGAGFGSADLLAAAARRPVLVNFFASWCVPCAEEAPMLAALAQAGLPIWGIAYKDRAADAVEFLTRSGNPYARLARDEPGRVAIDWGVYGVPESYLIDRAGIVRWRWAGPLTDAVVDRELEPLVRRLG